MALLDFDATAIEPSSFEAIPTGVYEAVISDSQMKDNRAGNGTILVLTIDIVSGEYTGRKLWENLNINHPNPTAVEIARQTLASICRALNIPRISDSSELHNRPMLISVRAVKQQDGSIRNDIKGYRPSGNASTKSAPARSPAPTPEVTANPTKTTSPWAR